VRFRAANQRLQNRQTHCRQDRIDTLGVNRVAVVDYESVRLIAWPGQNFLRTTGERHNIWKEHLPYPPPEYAADLQSPYSFGVPWR